MIFTMMPMAVYAEETEHTHSHSGWGPDNDETHSIYCINCPENYKEQTEAHRFDYDCDVSCDRCGFNRGERSHTYDRSEHDDTYHWEECVCGEKQNQAPHSYSADSDASCDCGYSRVVEPEHTHSYTAVVTAPTCSAQGYTTYTCSCNDSYVSDYVDALGHDWEEWQNNHDGTHMRICKRDRSHYEAAYCSYEVTDIGTDEHELTCPICGDSAWNDHEWVSIKGDPHAAMCTVCKKEAIDAHACCVCRRSQDSKRK